MVVFRCKGNIYLPLSQILIVMRNVFYVLFGLFLLMQYSCKHDKGEVITKKIQYDVNIKSPDPEYDWWIQNLVGPERERLVSLIVEGAKEGKWQAYDYFNDPIDKYEVRSIFSDTMVISMMKTDPPYELFDTMVIHNINTKDIIRIRFMEEWRVNPENLAFSKKVVGIAPVASRLDFNGIERWQPLFWIYTDDEFVKGFKTK